MPGLATAVLRSHVRFAFQEIEVGIEAGDAPARNLHQDEEHLEDHILWKKSVTQAITDDPNSMRHHVQHQNSKLLPYDVTQKKRHRRKEHGGDAKLILPDVEPDDSGVYSCHSLHRDRASIKTWTLIVLEASQTSLNTSLIFYNGAVLEVTFLVFAISVLRELKIIKSPT